MGLQSYVAIVRRHWILVCLITVTCVDVGAVASLTATPQYLARAGVFIGVETGTTPGQLARATDYGRYVARTYAAVATTPDALEPINRQFDLGLTMDQLTEKIVVRALVKTVVVEVAVTDPSPGRAAAIANAVAERLPALAAGLDASGGSTLQPAIVKTITPAAPPTFPVSPRRTTTLVLSLLLGALAGLVVAVTLDSRRPVVDGLPAMARITRAPVLGSVRLRRLRLRRRKDDAPSAELHAQFSRLCRDRFLRTVMLTSAVKGGPTSVAASELAVAAARAGSEVLLVDADLHEPALAGRGLGGPHGLSCALTGEQPWDDVVSRVSGTRLSVLPPGPPVPDPGALLGSARMAQLLTEVAWRYEVVLVKAPPVLRVDEGLALSRLTDAVVVVADEPAMSTGRLSAEVAALEKAGGRLAGVVMVS